jgi:predicted nucleotidyltransferase
MTNSETIIEKLHDIDFVIVLAKYNRKNIKILDDVEQNKIAKSIIKYLFTNNYNLRLGFLFNFFVFPNIVKIFIFQFESKRLRIDCERHLWSIFLGSTPNLLFGKGARG